MCRRCRWWLLLLLAAFWVAGSGGVRAQVSGAGSRPASAPQGDPLARSLRGAALQLAAALLSDSSGGIATPVRLPYRVAVLPLRMERGGGLPMGEPNLRAQFVAFLTSVRHGDAFVLAPLSAKDAAKMVRLMPKGVAKGDKPDAKMLDSARKVGADCVLYGTLTPPASGARDAAWLVNWLLIPVGSGGKEVPVVKASIVTTLVFGDGQR